MGDPKKAKKTYTTPRHPWQKARIVEEKEIVREYGLKNKKEVYKYSSKLKNMVNHYKVLNTLLTEQSGKEKEELLAKAVRYGLLKSDEDVSHLLNLKIKDILERRLQSIVLKKKLARSMKQARQFITHRHITVNGVVIDAPGYLVSNSDEAAIAFVGLSPLVDEQHPERAIEQKEIKAELEATKVETPETPVAEPAPEASEPKVEEVVAGEAK